VNAATAVAALVALTGALVGGRALAVSPEPGTPAARFVAFLGIALSLFFVLAIAAASIPNLVLRACE
jgi:hypothetical protein